MPSVKSTRAVGGLRHYSMCRQLLSALPFVVLLMTAVCHMCGPACASSAEHFVKTALFAPRETRLPGRPGSAEIGRVVRFVLPSLVATDDVMVAFAGAIYTRNPIQSVGIVARFVATEGDKWAERAAEGNWTTQLVMQESEEWDYANYLRTALAVARGGKIYLLIISYNGSSGQHRFPHVSHWHLDLLVGETVRPGGWAERADKRIEWKELDLPRFDIADKFKNQSLTLRPSAGSTLLTADGRIVFVLPASGAGRSVSAIIHSKMTDNETKWDWSYVETSTDCYFSSFVWWEGKLVMIPAFCSVGGQKVKESTDMGKTWTDAAGSVGKLWGQLQDKYTFTRATIENKTVLLSTQLKNREKQAGRGYEIRLWVLTGSCMRDVGAIVADNHLVIPSDIVYTNGELFFSYQRWSKRSTSTFFLRLNEQLNTIKSVLRTCDMEGE